MKADIKTKWLAALRSGQYEQTALALRNGNGYCCLGVLCDIYSRETGAKWEDTGSGKFAMHGADGVLPYGVRAWAELTHEKGACVVVEAAHVSLTDLNDARGYDFRQIADVIEEQL